MSYEQELLDPTSERQLAGRNRPQRPQALEGLTIGLLDIAKARGDVYLDRLEELMRERGIQVRRYAKPTNTRVAPTEVKQRIAAECDVVVEGLSD